MFNNLPLLFSMMDKVSEEIDKFEKECQPLPFSTQIPIPGMADGSILYWGLTNKRLMISEICEGLPYSRPLKECSFVVRLSALPLLSLLQHKINLQIDEMVATLRNQGAIL